MSAGSARRSFAAGDKVTRAGYDGVVIGEYLPGMYEVRLASGDVVVPAEELTPRDEEGQP
ncbi:hypothetical protein H7J07_05195 [Mycobacterium koreense]|uniref:Uncharacterized protein n=1 Tax=Mycolicibacillus koreensis TaxID=1069220 RepID=A0A7I7SCI5_9MYCO|nr:hypothetical protein [Mycolicibacillus koreensis]MCV7247620.1 hypothetical protein [Mycolicibacillus koreensis]OSC32804.1 hypothetical protein B8W67_13705 [Mycolicibacillus koreensis]BBY53999.1 hypothetical protein MKOR_12500 [Mycolicibacillus koreensis]